MKHLVLTLALGSLFVASAQATTYVRVEKDGTKTYSDRPIPGGQVVEMEPAQTYSAPPQSSVDSRLPREQQLVQAYDEFKYQSCAITPAPDSTYTNPESVPISIDLKPSQRPVDVITLTIDGQSLAPNMTSHVMSPVNRGTHTVTLTIKNLNGQVICTASSSFHVQRPSLNSPARSR
jgi:hypothetical protein